MSKLAIIATGGKQYKVRPGQDLLVERLTAEPEAEVQLDTLLLADEQSGDLQVGQPLLELPISAQVIEHGRHDKIKVVKYKNKTRYKRTLGHRQSYTKIKIKDW